MAACPTKALVTFLPMRKPAKTITINHVATAAGVSTATISRALNQPTAVRPALRERIQKIIKKLGYIPNASARSLMLRRSGTIGMIVPTLDNAIFAQGLAAFQSQLLASHYQLLVASSNYDPEIEAKQINNLLVRGVEGIAFFGISQQTEILQLLQHRGVPYIHIGALNAPLGGFCSGYDNQRAIKLGVQHLINLGHTEFGMIAGITNNNDRARDRVKGSVSLLKKNKIPLTANWIVECPYTIEAAREGLAQLLRTNPKLTAIICGNDVLALGALLEARKRGIAVPEKMSIIGFDDLELSRHLMPSLTTLHVDANAMWTEAAKHLIAQIDGANQLPQEIKTTVNLVIRESTGKSP